MIIFVWRSQLLYLNIKSFLFKHILELIFSFCLRFDGCVFNRNICGVCKKIPSPLMECAKSIDIYIQCPLLEIFFCFWLSLALSLQTVECNVKQGRIKSTYIRNMRSATLTSRLAFQGVNKRQFISQLNCSAYSREHNDRWVVSDPCMIHSLFFPFIFAKPFGHCASVLPLCVTGNIFLLKQFISVRETR